MGEIELGALLLTPCTPENLNKPRKKRLGELVRAFSTDSATLAIAVSLPLSSGGEDGGDGRVVSLTVGKTGEGTRTVSVTVGMVGNGT